MHRRRTLIACLLGALTLIGCEAPGGKTPSAPPPEPSLLNPDGFNLLVVTDTSKSMDSTDPMGFNREGAQLAVALANATDNLGLVPFSSDVHGVVPLAEMGAQGRQDLSHSIDRLENNGKTDFIKSLEAASTQLAPASGESAVIFFSDGEHNPGRSIFAEKSVDQQKAEEAARIKQLAKDLGAANRRVFTIALGQDADTTRLAEIAALSGGALYHVARADELLDAYLEILGDVYGLFEYDRDPADLRLGPATRRLIYVLIKNDQRARAGLAGTLAHDDAPVDLDAESVYHRSGSTFDVVQFDHDLAGRWTCGVASAQGQVVALSKVPIAFSIVPGSPGGEYEQGGTIGMALEARCDDEELARYTAEQVRVTARCGADGTDGALVELKATRQGNQVRFAGSTTALHLGDGDRALDQPQTVSFEIHLADEGWTNVKKTSLLVLGSSEPAPPPPPPSGALKLGAGKLSLGEFWAGAVRLEQGLELTNTSELPVVARFELEGGLVAPPAETRLAPGATAKLPLKLAAGQPAAGKHHARITVQGHYVDSDTAVDPVSADLELSVFGASLGKPDTKPLPPGFKGNVRAPVQLAPAGTALAIVKHSEPQNPAGVQFTWPTSIDEKGLSLAVTVPERTPGGVVQASFSARPRGSAMKPRSFKLRFSVTPSRPVLSATQPKPLSFDLAQRPGGGEDIWVEFPGDVQVSLDHFAPLKLKISRSELAERGGGEPIPQFDLRVRPPKGKLVPGTPGTLKLELKVHDLLTAGHYEGTLTLSVDGGSGEPESVELKVVVELH